MILAILGEVTWRWALECYYWFSIVGSWGDSGKACLSHFVEEWGVRKLRHVFMQLAQRWMKIPEEVSKRTWGEKFPFTEDVDEISV